MKRRTEQKKLVLSRETIRSLNDDVLGAVAGGCRDSNTCQTMCDCPCKEITLPVVVPE